MRSQVVAVVVLAAVVSGCAPAGQDGPVPVAAPRSEATTPVGRSPSPGRVDTPGTEPPAATGTPADDAAAPRSVVTPSPASGPRVTFVRHADRPDPAYRFEAALPVVTGVPPGVADAVEHHVAAWYADVRAAYVADEASFASAGEPPDDVPPGWLEVAGTAGAVTPTLLSVAFTVTTMHRAALHPWTVVEAFTFDLATGEVLALTDLFAPGEPVLATISAQVVPRLVAKLDPEGEGWAEAGVRDGAAPDPDRLRRFVVDEDGLTLHFDQYQVAPGVAGHQQVTLGWEGLLADLAPSERLARALDDLR